MLPRVYNLTRRKSKAQGPDSFAFPAGLYQNNPSIGQKMTGEDTMELRVNNQVFDVDVEPEMPLLWVLRDILNLKGTKFACGIAQCGACTVHIDGEPVRSCSFPAAAAAGKAVTTIEGLSDDASHPVQQAWIKHQVPQCGYCQSGQIMAAVSLLAKKPQPTDADINAAMTNICRCGTYKRIRDAIHDVAGNSAEFYQA